MNRVLEQGLRTVRRIVIAVVGTTVLLFGLALMVLPGPAFVVVPVGLGILALEFAWARRWLQQARALYEGRTAGGRAADADGSPDSDSLGAPPGDPPLESPEPRERQGG